jgi:hypothetical protein
VGDAGCPFPGPRLGPARSGEIAEHYTAAALIGAIVIVVLLSYPLALASRPRVRLSGDTKRWRRVEQLVEQLRRVLPRVEELDHEIDRRITSLERLVMTLRSINDDIPRSDRRRLRQRARLVGEHADAALAAAARWRYAADPGAEVVERADAYATVYRELSEHRPGEAGWRA